MSRRPVLRLAALLAGVALVRAGRRVTFAVTNAGRLPHEFILGDRATPPARPDG